MKAHFVFFPYFAGVYAIVVFDLLVLGNFLKKKANIFIFYEKIAKIYK